MIRKIKWSLEQIPESVVRTYASLGWLYSLIIMWLTWNVFLVLAKNHVALPDAVLRFRFGIILLMPISIRFILKMMLKLLGITAKDNNKSDDYLALYAFGFEDFAIAGSIVDLAFAMMKIIIFVMLVPFILIAGLFYGFYYIFKSNKQRIKEEYVEIFG